MSIKYNIFFIDKTQQKEKEIFFCRVCEYPLNTKEDFISSKDYHVCHNCFLTFIESRKKEWENGWRPSKNKIKEHIYNKSKLI